MKPTRPAYTLTLRAEPGNWTAPPIVRLRHFLKAALRGYGLRCVNARELLPEQPATDTPDTAQPKSL